MAKKETAEKAVEIQRQEQASRIPDDLPF